ncbi:MAG TPA: protein kinase [Terriglobales bacterium]|nr:protein kinase [Terriglobales bacterium]
MSLTRGTKLGSYEILSPLGAGGMGEVYRARDAALGRDVAVKVLPAIFSRDADRLRRFKQEAQAAAALNHPNILTIYHVGEHNGAPYIVSELLDGESLRQRLDAGSLPVRKTMEYAVQVARGLAAAHSKGIIHRDLKPENLFLNRDGRAKILDFGLAKLTRPEASASTELPSVTAASEPGSLLGTVGYMSPEQVRGQVAGPASDLFSFGVILYEMLTGKRAFRGDTAADTMSAILKEDPPEMVNPQIPDALARIVRHCLEKHPEERFQSAHDLAFDLEALSGLPATGAPATAATDSKPHKWLVPFAAALVLLVLGMAGDRFLRKTGPSPLPTFHQLTFKPGLIYAARFAPDGQTVLYSASWDGQGPQLYSTVPDGPESRALSVKDSNLFAASSAGIAISVGCRLIFPEDCEGTLATMPLSGGAPRELAEQVNAADWMADGSQLAIVRQVAGRYRLEFPLGKVLYETIGWLRYVRTSPRGDAVAFVEHPQRGSDIGFVVVLDAGGSRKLRSGPWVSLEGLGWSPQGDEVWVAGTKDHAWANEIHGLDFSGEDRLLLRLPGMLRLHDISPQGQLLLSREIWRSGIMFRGPGDTRERELSWLDYSVVSDLSADGRNLAFFEPGEAARVLIFAYMRKSDGSPAVRLGDCSFPSFSPDQKWVLCVSVSGDQLAVLSTGVGETKSIRANQIVRYGKFGWLPDGNGIFFEGNDGRGWRIYTQDLVGGRPTPVTPEVLVVPERSEANLVSPDGRWVEVRELDGKRQLYPLAGGDSQPARGMDRDDVWVNWSNSGRSGYIRDWAKVPAKVFRLDLSTGKKQPFLELAPGDPIGLSAIRSVRITPDGKSYAYTYERALSELYLVEGLRQAGLKDHQRR